MRGPRVSGRSGGRWWWWWWKIISLTVGLREVAIIFHDAFEPAGEGEVIHFVTVVTKASPIGGVTSVGHAEAIEAQIVTIHARHGVATAPYCTRLLRQCNRPSAAATSRRRRLPRRVVHVVHVHTVESCSLTYGKGSLRNVKEERKSKQAFCLKQGSQQALGLKEKSQQAFG